LRVSLSWVSKRKSLISKSLRHQLVFNLTTLKTRPRTLFPVLAKTNVYNNLLCGPTDCYSLDVCTQIRGLNQSTRIELTRYSNAYHKSRDPVLSSYWFAALHTSTINPDYTRDRSSRMFWSITVFIVTPLKTTMNTIKPVARIMKRNKRIVTTTNTEENFVTPYAENAKRFTLMKTKT